MISLTATQTLQGGRVEFTGRLMKAPSVCWVFAFIKTAAVASTRFVQSCAPRLRVATIRLSAIASAALAIEPAAE
jgi:hypothetical protein